MELVAPYRIEINGVRRAGQNDVDVMGLPLGQYWEMVLDDWDQAGTMRARWLPRARRDGWTLYRVYYPTG